MRFLRTTPTNEVALEAIGRRELEATEGGAAGVVYCEAEYCFGYPTSTGSSWNGAVALATNAAVGAVRGAAS